MVQMTCSMLLAHVQLYSLVSYSHDEISQENHFILYSHIFVVLPMYPA
jgi:hypothetical protein